MNKNYAILIAVVVAIVVAGARMRRPPDRKQIEKEIATLNATLPRNVDTITTQTRVELVDNTINSYYAVTQVMENDATVTETLRQGILKQLCAKPDARKALALGYSLNNVYAVRTPRGPDQISVLIKSTDCG